MPDWMAALPFPATILSFENNRLAMVGANAAFAHSFECILSGKAERSHAAEWRKRIVESILSGRDSEGFRSEEHTSELQSLMRISYAVFCLKNKTTQKTTTHLDKNNIIIKILSLTIPKQ